MLHYQQQQQKKKTTQPSASPHRLYLPLRVRFSRPAVFRCRPCMYLVDVRHLRSHVVLFERLLFGLPAWEWQHHLRGMRHPEERRNKPVTLMHVHGDRSGSPSKYYTRGPHERRLMVTAIIH